MREPYKKVLNGFFSLLLIAFLTHFLSLHIPGDPFSSEKPLRPEAVKVLRSYYGLDDPWYIQFGRYLAHVIQGNLGRSLVYEGVTVNQLILRAFPVSAILGLSAFFLALCMGISLGMVGAFYRNRWQDRSIFFFTALILSVPNFILAILFQYFFAIRWSILPIAKWEGISSGILPLLSLACVPCVFIAKQIRENTLRALDQEYILLARVKKLPNYRILFFHLLPNITLPLFGYFGQLATNILTGSFLIERIFAIPGLGFWFVSSILERDYSVILGLTLFYSVLLIMFGLLMDLGLYVFDPRIRRRGDA